MSIHPFPKIPSYRREADPIHAVRAVVCLEKIDGTNTRVHAPRAARSAADLVFGGRTLLEHMPDFCQPLLREAFTAHALAVRRLCELVDELGRDLTLYGETCGRGIQAQGHIYGPRPHFVLFAARSAGAWLGFNTPLTVDGEDEETTPRTLPSLRALAAQLGVPIAPCLYEGPPDSMRFEALLEQPSAHALTHGRRTDGPQEGIVIWSDPLLLDGAGRPLVAKFKHPRRSEARELDDERAGEPVEAFAERVVLLERLHHARQHLEESGRWTGTQAERAALLTRRVVQDVAREEPTYQRQIAAAGKAPVRAALERRVAELLTAALYYPAGSDR